MQLELAFIANNNAKDILVMTSADAINWTPNVVLGKVDELGGCGHAALGGRMIVSSPYINKMNSRISDAAGDYSGPSNITPGVAQPALASHNGRVFAALIRHNTNKIHIHSTADGVNWEHHGQAATAGLGAGLGLASHAGKLFLSYFDLGGPSEVFVTSSADGSNWSNPVASEQGSNGPAALVSFNGKLRMVFVAANVTREILTSTSDDGILWTQNVPSGKATSTGPTVAVMNNRLYMLLVANNATNELLSCWSDDGSNWSDHHQIGGSARVWDSPQGNVFGTLGLAVRP